MDVRLQEIAGKAAGTYFIVTDNSGSNTEYVAPAKLRVAFINDELGPVNTAVYFAQGNISGFNKIFGNATRKKEKSGNFSHLVCESMLTAGPLAVINLRAFNHLDTIGLTAMSPNSNAPESVTTEYVNVFNTNTLWTPRAKQIPGLLTQENLLNFANIGNSDKSIFVVLASNPETLTADYELRLTETDLSISDYPALVANQDLKIQDTIVDVYIFDTVFDNTSSTNKYYGHLFTPAGLIEYGKLAELSTIPEAGFNRKIAGSFIPDLINENNENISIDMRLQNVYAETGIICYINDDVLEMEEYDDLPTINTSGTNIYNVDGTLKVSGGMLSYRAQTVTPEIIDLDEIGDENVIDYTSKRLLQVENSIDSSTGEVFGMFETKTRVGDTLLFTDGVDVLSRTIIGMEQVETVQPGDKELIVRGKPTLSTIGNGTDTIDLAINVATVQNSTDNILRIYRKLSTAPNSTYTLVNTQTITTNMLSYADSAIVPANEYIYYVEVSDPTNSNQTVTSLSMRGDATDDQTPGANAGGADMMPDGPTTVPYTKTWTKVKYTLDESLPADIYENVSDYTRVMSFKTFVTGLTTPTSLTSYKPRVEQFTNGSATRQKEVLDMMLSPGIRKGLKNLENVRYLIDCFKSFVEANYKYQFHELAQSLDLSNTFVRAICNEPFVEDLENSTDPLFKEAPGGTFDIKYIAKGGNPDWSIKSMSKPDSLYCFFYGSETNGRQEYPTAGKVSNLFIDKTFDFDVVANETGIISLIGLPLQPDEEERKAMEDFRWNPFVKMGDQYRIYGNFDAQKKMTGLTQIQNSELLCFIKYRLFNMSRNEAFRKGTYNEYLSTETAVNNFMQSLVLANAIQPNPVVVCSAENNTSDIQKARIKLIHIEYFQVNSLDKVVFDLNVN